MKKIILSLVAGVAILSSCDPVSNYADFDQNNYTEEQAANCVSFKVYKDEACTQEAGPAEGNYVKFTTSPATSVAILNKTAQGDDNLLAWGTGGVFKLSPKRGSSTEQELIVRIVNSDNSSVEAKKMVSVFVKGDLDPEYKLLLGQAGKKSWTWDYDGPVGNCWGNGGHTGNGDGFTARAIDGNWWGVSTPEGLLEQLQHSDTNQACGEEAVGAYMTFDEDGNITTCDPSGKVIRSGSYEIKNYNKDRNIVTFNGTDYKWQLGKLVTSAPAVLFPFSINEGGKTVTEFDIMYLDANHMTLVYTKGAAASGWGEITHWLFKSTGASSDILEGNAKWGWADDGNGCWGNAGNSGNGAGYTATAIDGKWWGVTKGSELSGQLGHSEGGTDFGDADDNAYMVFKDGSVTSYKGDGTQIRTAKYEITNTNRVNNWELGKLTTTAPGVLFPFSINEGGKYVNEFDVMYMDGDNMTLVYTKGNGAGSWGEITYWRFAAK